ncbi:HAD family hydrolase [Streptomyces sp. BR1]|uniref:HAD family hydrolase n=1 Tax=Streptomyces sp. BR1 TaxID=1592323 RepID=UPI00402B691A
MRVGHDPSGFVEAVIFDHDGVIVDSITPDFEACSQVFREYGAELSAEAWAGEVCGYTDGYPGLFAALAERTGHGPDAVQAMLKRLAELWDESLVPHRVPLMPGVQDTLDRLRREGIRTAVASAAPRSWVLGCLERHGVRDVFETVVTADDVERKKPAPDVYLEAVRRLGVAPARCLAVEDSLAGVAAARAAGLRVLAVPTALTRSLDYAAADLVLDGLPHVPAELFGPPTRKAAHVRH